MKTIDELRALIRDVPDFPKRGISFKDITPLLLDGTAYRAAIHHMVEQVRDSGVGVVASPEARGFLFGPAVAHQLGCGFVPIRKPGKLPYDVTSVTYDLEYGQDTVAMHVDAINPGDRVLLVDDVLATGGTMAACAELVESKGGVISGCHFLMELTFLDGRARLKDYQVNALMME